MTTRWVPKYCVWETTLACNAACVHCGSGAGSARAEELSTEEAFAMIRALAKLRCESVTLSGGEPLVRRDWPLLAERITETGMRAELITNGLLVDERADDIRDAGLFAVTMSVDGTAAVHDGLRGVTGALDQLLKGAAALVSRGVRIGAVTQINKRNIHQLEAIHDLIRENGFEGWQVQLTVPLGRAERRRSDLFLAPQDLLTIESVLSRIRSRSDLFIQIADTIGYMGRAEPALRSGTGVAEGLWPGCSAGLRAVGITSDGTVRGCLSMAPCFDEGNIRERPLESIWNDETAFAYNRSFSPATLKGACATCALARFCRGGCTNLAFVTSGDAGRQTYCLRQVYKREVPFA